MYILYKHPIQLETLHIVQYLHHNHICFVPATIVERNHPPNVIELPTIYYNYTWYSGLEQCIQLYETYSGIDNILEKANEFKRLHPKYTIKK